MPIPLDPYFRRRIVTLWKSGENISSIVRVQQTEGRKTVRRWIFHWQYNRGLKDSHRRGRLLKITREIAVYMDEQLKEDDELSSVELQRLVSRNFAVELSPSTIRRYLRTSLQWVVVRTRFGPMISDNNKTERVDFARMCLDTNDDFSNVIWTDESSVQLRRHSQTMQVKVWMQGRMRADGLICRMWGRLMCGSEGGWKLDRALSTALNRGTASVVFATCIAISVPFGQNRVLTSIAGNVSLFCSIARETALL